MLFFKSKYASKNIKLLIIFVIALISAIVAFLIKPAKK
jgi:hypothetical protein